ncbi:hypothetical protein DSM104443_00359 [Usitatibacter rugosus]|uniref:SURF1-like protein n=1 Tax=Usitatibacter rugosus TaxID=2732067 RepID=A0A6M4GQ26_9PROT|nr:SURF1 family protein [Usitatibacter rugosus]QJR09321.1 hypothetical protein DSM104443_00359 [Usitatibacter rugosus]
MRIGAFHFTPRLVPTVAAVAMIALLVSLGRWQVARAGEKQARQALLEARMQEPVLRLSAPIADAAPVVYRHVAAEGRYVPEGQVFIDNRLHLGRAGFHVMTPLRLASGATVLVNRGWIARDAQYPKPPAVAVPEGRVTVAGLAATPPARYLELSTQTVSGNVWQNLSFARYREHVRIDVMPFEILVAPPAPGLAAVEEQPDAGVAKHQEYALTWFSLAVTVLVLWIVVNTKRIA